MSLLSIAALVAFMASDVALAQAPVGVPADALGDRGDQHIDYPSWSSVYPAPAMSVASVGDVNGDGLEDIAAGFGNTYHERDSVYVTFSDRFGGAGSALSSGGFRILTDRFSHGASSAGDLNGDGFGDIAVVQGERVSVVLGKRDGGIVDTAALDEQGFTIAGVGSNGSSGSSVYYNSGVVPLGDLNGDGVNDLLLEAGDNAAIVYPPRDAAGSTIDASAPGPYVSTLTATGAQTLAVPYVGNLGDIDGDGRDDVMVAGQEREGRDQVAYGVVSPPPGVEVDLPSVATDRRGFELRARDLHPSGFVIQLQSVLTIGDQNGDGSREVGLLGHREGLYLRVAFSPPVGTRSDVSDLGPFGARGYALRPYSQVIDVGDQNGDGRGDLSTFNYIHFTDPERQAGDGAFDGPGFSFIQGGGTVVAPIRDLNGDGKPELAVARVTVRRNDRSDSGEDATYAVDVFDSAATPTIALPEPPKILDDGLLQVTADLQTGAGERGGGTLGVEPKLQIATASGRPKLARVGGIVAGAGGRTRVSLTAPVKRALGGRALVPGRTYRVRYAAANGRGLAAEGPWRSFVFRSGLRRGTRRADRLRGTRGRDRLLGLAGADLLIGRAGNDLLRGGEGDDRLVGGPGRDLLDGGRGNDRFEARDGERDTVRCGRGRDRVRADRADRVVGCEDVRRGRPRRG